MGKSQSQTELGSKDALRKYKAEGTSDSIFGLKRPPRTNERLILEMRPLNFTCCGLPDVFAEETVTRMPEELVKAGVDAGGWQQHILAIKSAIQEHSTPACKELLLCLTIVGFCYLDVKLKNMHDALRLAVEKMNRELLEPRGCFAKTQGGEYHSLRTHKRVSWLSVALTPSESAILREEPHIYKYNFFNTELSPINEDDCNFCYSTKVWGASKVF